MSSSVGEADQASIISLRAGHVLLRHNILKSDHFPGAFLEEPWHGHNAGSCALAPSVARIQPTPTGTVQGLDSGMSPLQQKLNEWFVSSYHDIAAS